MVSLIHSTSKIVLTSNQNFGIVVAFAVAFIFGLLAFSEFNTTSASETAVILFKRGTKSYIVQEGSSSNDEEKVQEMAFTMPADHPAPTSSALGKPAVTDIFSWQHIQYTVPVPDGQRRLLDDVSGYVAPGKLTALMGERLVL